MLLRCAIYHFESFEFSDWLPIGHAWLVERHEVYLTWWCTFGTTKEHLVVAFAQEFQALCFFVHKHTVQMTAFDRTNLPMKYRNKHIWLNRDLKQLSSTHITHFYCFIAPAHNLSCTDVGHGCRHFTPLQKRMINKYKQFNALHKILKSMQARISRD